MSQTTFQDFALSSSILQSLQDMNFVEPTEIQKKTLEALIGHNGDLLALAETGSGKTAAYAIPLLEQIKADDKSTQGLILCPTRELAIQVSEQVQKLGRAQKINVATIYGGASYTIQERDLKRGAQILIATPGRLIDFIEQKKISLARLNVLVLDEADEMISMGFKEDLETILSEAHENCQNWLFSATMSRNIEQISHKYLTDPKRITVNSSGKLPESIEHWYYAIAQARKRQALLQIMSEVDDFYGIIFCQTKVETEAIQNALVKAGFSAESFHGDRTQKEREKILTRFRKREVAILVCTDVAARGLDIKDLSHVINYSLPWDFESYIHRVGRTGRNGQKGIAISLITRNEQRGLENIARRTKTTFVLKKMQSVEQIAKTKVSHALTKIIDSFAGDTKSMSFKKAEALVRELLEDKQDVFAPITKEQLLTQVIYNSLKNVLTMGENGFGLNEDEISFSSTGGDDREDRRPRGRDNFRGGGGRRRDGGREGGRENHFDEREEKGSERRSFGAKRPFSRDDRPERSARPERAPAGGASSERRTFARKPRGEGADAPPRSRDESGGFDSPRRKKGGGKSFYGGGASSGRKRY
ncbi:MAG: DEAD/DEAH box helicase [Bdellovibrionales bacterium]|nr:DEAD/DEAH box helicase [Bdellovibrionales bacterium]